MSGTKKLRFVLGDQLNLSHSWFTEIDKQTLYLMVEMRQETDYVTHHIQKVVGFFAAMREFASAVKAKGHQVIYINIDQAEAKEDLGKLIQAHINSHEIGLFEYQEPDEYRLDLQFQSICEELDIPTKVYSTEHFYTDRKRLKKFFEGKKQLIMEPFYRQMRKEHQILMTPEGPLGGKWNYDQENRKKWKGQIPVPTGFPVSNNLLEIYKSIQSQSFKTIGSIDATQFNWPINKNQAQQILDYFCENLLPYFGDFQDAMHTQEKFLFHSRLSFALNTKIISPKEVVDQVLKTYYEQKEDKISLNQVEGFVRQILGWREYMRGIYWREMPGYAQKNALDNQGKLPDFYWTAKTKMNCMHQSIKQSLEHSYAHHIQRLMVTGNYALLTQVHPDEVDKWYLGIYIDAIEWVEMPNTRGMSQFADGGLLATKPYVSSGNYIQKMGNYCEGCQYNHKEKIGENACPFNSLYWNFLDEKKGYFEKNNRMAMMLSLLKKMDPNDLKDIKKRAFHIIENPSEY